MTEIQMQIMNRNYPERIQHVAYPKGHLVIGREDFIAIMEAIQKQSDHDTNFSNALSEFMWGPGLIYENNALPNALIKILEVAFDDNARYSTIQHFVEGMNFGRWSTTIEDDYGNTVDISDAGKLYDYLMRQPIP